MPRRATRYVLAVDGAALVGLAVAAALSRWHPADAALFAVLVGCALVSVEGSRHLGAPATRRDRPYKDMLSTWMLPAAVLLPPLYAVLIPIPVYLLVQARVTRIPPFKRVFNGASVALAGLLAGFTYRALAGASAAPSPGALAGSGRALAAAGAAAAVFSAVSACLVAGILRRVSTASRRTAFAGWPLQATEGAELCLGVVVALLCSIQPLLALIVLPPMLLLQRTLLHTELVEAARTDAKTGLTNPRHWRDVAERELVRARRGAQEVTVLLVDIDRFKHVNDTYGHLIGDQVIVAVAQELRAAVRPLDLVGRFGGDEFVLLLTDTSSRSARATAQRITSRVETLSYSLVRDAAPLRVTVSIGVAALGDAADDLAGLLAAADRACFAAKAAGRNRVRVAEDTGHRSAVVTR